MKIRLNTPVVSRYSTSVISAVVMDAPAQTFTMRLTRRNFGVVHEGEWVSNGDARQNLALDLALVKHPTHGFSLARRGIYDLSLVDPANLLPTQYADVIVSIATPASLKQRWLSGIQLYAAETLKAYQQNPTLMVSVEYVDPGTYKGLGTLAYTAAVGATPATLQWQPYGSAGLGAAVPVVGDEWQTVQLVSLEGDSYIECRFDPLWLPSSDRTESILIDNWRVTDGDLLEAIHNAADYVQAKTSITIEPHAITTDPHYIDTAAGKTEPDPYDVKIQAETYYSNAASFQVTWSASAAVPLLAADWIQGRYGAAGIYKFPKEWVIKHDNGGVVDILPSSAISYPSTFFTQSGVFLHRAGLPIPNFWHIGGWAGVAELTGRWADVKEAIERVAVREILVKLNTAANNGRSSASASRDGVSESWSYAQGGPHAELIKEHDAWLEVGLRRIKNRIPRVLVME